MSEVNNAEQLRTWFRGCPFLASGVRFNADYVAGKAAEYAIYSVPSALKYHENILGDEVPDDNQTQNFIFVAELPYGADVQQNLANLGFMQAVADWILRQNMERVFPTWDGGRIKSILPTLTGAPVQVGASSAKYQIQLKVNYRRI